MVAETNGEATDAIRRVLCNGRWHGHHYLVARAAASLPPETGLRQYRKKRKKWRTSKVSVSEQTFQGNLDLVQQSLSQLVTRKSAVRREAGDAAQYWLVPKHWKAKMIDPRYVDLPLDKIIADPEIQPRDRDEIDEDIPKKYATDLEAGDDFPPVIVFRDEDGKNWLADGFYRLAAHALAGRKTIPAVVSDGTRRDALLFSCGANADHGTKPGEKSLERVVRRLLEDPEWQDKGTAWIAKTCRVDEERVTAASSRERNRQAAEQTTGEVLPQGGDRRSEDAKSKVNLAFDSRQQRAEANSVSLAQQKKLDNLARRAPALHAKVQAGEMSCHAACLEAGITKVPTPFDILVRAWKKASKEERRQFDQFRAQQS